MLLLVQLASFRLALLKLFEEQPLALGTIDGGKFPAGSALDRIGWDLAASRIGCPKEALARTEAD